MKNERTYYSRISKLFAVIAIVLFICLIFAEIGFAKNIIATRNHVAEIQLEAKRQKMVQTLSSVSGSILNTIISPELSDYLTSEYGSSGYYYNSIRLQNVMKSNPSFFESSIFTVGISRKERAATVMTATSAYPKEYFMKLTGFDSFQNMLDGKSGISMKKDENGSITSMMLVQTLSTKSGEFIAYIHIPLDTVLGDSDGGNFELSVYDAGRNKLTSRNPEIERMDMKPVLNRLSWEQRFVSGPYMIAPVKLPFFETYLLISSEDTISAKLWVLLAASLIILGMLILTILSRMKDSLYKPIGDAVNLLTRGKDAKPKDELAFIIDNCRKIDELHEELDEAMKAHRQLKEQQKYRAFIRGEKTEVAEDDSSSYFTLAYASVTEKTENPDVVFARINNVIKYIEHFHSIRVDSTHNVYIYKSGDKQQSYDMVYRTLQTLTFDLVESDDIRFALTEPEKGYKALPGMFNTAGDIMQYRYRIKQHPVLTCADIPEAEHLMNYTFSDERILVNAMISDNEDALNIFDRIVEKNISDSHLISRKEMIRFCYSMTGTLNRVFQEFKETPETLLGHPVDFEKLYKNRNSREVLEQVRTAFAEILEARKSRNVLEDDKMIVQMKEYISEHYMENLMLIDLSKKYNLTPKYCSFLFKSLSNDTFKNYLNQLRIEKACEMLTENPRLKIRDLSEMVGFQSSNSFIRAFSRVMGITPGSYAKKLQATR